jgi:hypothetical protein
MSSSLFNRLAGIYLIDIEYMISPTSIRKTIEETNTNRQSFSIAKPNSAATIRRIGVNISNTSPANIKIAGSILPENIRKAKSPSDGFAKNVTTDEGQIAAVSNPKVISIALVHTPSWSTLPVQFKSNSKRSK